jgi:hypothetical protein
VYGGARLKVWQVVVLGALWIALGVILDQTIDWDPPRHYSGYYVYRRSGTHELFVALKMWLTGPLVIGLFHWYRAFEAYSARRAEASSTDLPVQPAAPVPFRPSVPLPPPPRIGDDPFRDPPAAPPIVVHRPPTAPTEAPIVPGDPSDKPKLLT